MWYCGPCKSIDRGPRRNQAIIPVSAEPLAAPVVPRDHLCERQRLRLVSGSHASPWGSPLPVADLLAGLDLGRGHPKRVSKLAGAFTVAIRCGQALRLLCFPSLPVHIPETAPHHYLRHSPSFQVCSLGTRPVRLLNQIFPVDSCCVCLVSVLGCACLSKFIC